MCQACVRVCAHTHTPSHLRMEKRNSLVLPLHPQNIGNVTASAIRLPGAPSYQNVPIMELSRDGILLPMATLKIQPNYLIFAADLGLRLFPRQHRRSCTRHDTPPPPEGSLSRIVYLAEGSSPASDPCWSGCKGEQASQTWRVTSSKQPGKGGGGIPQSDPGWSPVNSQPQPHREIADAHRGTRPAQRRFPKACIQLGRSGRDLAL